MMLDDGKIKARQAGFLMFSFLMGSAILLIPGIVTSIAKQDGWLSMILASLFGIGIVYIYTTLGLMFPKQSIIQYSEIILGKWVGKIVGLLYIWFFFHLGTVVTRNFSDFILTIALTGTPAVIISGAFLAVIAFAIRGGIETISRVDEIILPVRELVVILIIILVLKELKPDNFMPIMGEGVIPILKGSIPATAFPFGETILFAMLLPNISNIQKVKKTYVVTILLSGISLTIIVMLTILVLGPLIASRMNFPVQTVIQHINIAGFLTNLDALGMLIWVSTGFVKIAICYYCTAIGIAQWFRLSDYRSIVTPVGILILIFSISVYQNYVEETSLSSSIWPFYALPFELLLPLLLLIIAKIRKLDGREKVK
jgi:spore germination protein KB